MILDLHDPPPPPPDTGRPRLFLVRRGPPVVFSVPTDPEIPWYRKVIWGTLALIITVTAAAGIILFAALVKYMYDTVDARSAPQQQPAAPEGTIPLSLSDRPPERAPAGAPEETGDAGETGGGSQEEGPEPR